MKLLVGLVSSNKWLCDKFNKEQSRLVPKNKKFDFIKFGFKIFNPDEIREGLQERLRKNIGRFDAIILLTEWRHEDEISSLRNSFFINIFRYVESEGNHNNYFQYRVGKLVKNFVDFNEVAKNADVEKLSILPIRNFQSNDLFSLTRVFNESVMDDEFINKVNSILNKMKRMKQPRRESKDKKQYIVDGKKRYFEFGKDKEHGSFATGGEHLASCEISGVFRFGRKVLQEGHFNICLEKNKVIWGEFQDCHDMTILIKKSAENDHLNMFINDHIRGEESIIKAEGIKQKPK